MYQLCVSKIAEKKIRAGVQLLDSRDLPENYPQIGLVDLVNQRGEVVARAYLAPQHKGVGWVLPDQPETVGLTYFVALFERAKMKRQAFEQSELTTAYRLFNQDGDDFGGLTIDRYGDFAVFSLYNEQVAVWLEQLVTAFRQVYPELRGAYLKRRYQTDENESAHLFGEEAPETFTVLENGVRYSIFLNDGLMTGIFLDQHEIRGRLVDGLAAGQTMLNMFSYTAAFSVAAAVGGAYQTTSVDLAKRSRELSQAHFQANGLCLDDHKLVVMDVFDYFRYAKRKGFVYDVIVLDPPSFARNKKQTFSVAKDYHKLISQSLEILSPNGLIIASTNASNVSKAQFEQQLKKGLGDTAYRILYRDGLPSDFTTNPQDERSQYLKVVTIQVNQ